MGHGPDHHQGPNEQVVRDERLQRTELAAVVLRLPVSCKHDECVNLGIFRCQHRDSSSCKTFDLNLALKRLGHQTC